MGAAVGAEGDLLPPMSASSQMPLFLEEPQDTYVIKNAHATLRCSAINALQVRKYVLNILLLGGRIRAEWVPSGGPGRRLW